MLGKLTKKNLVRNERGFSLVELMVVVAIIGVLAAIAVPNVTRYIAKSRQSEAKTNLGALFSANQTFFTEYNTYTNGFQAMGFRPIGALRYSVGFGATAVNTAANLALFGYTGTAPTNATTGFSGTAGYCVATSTSAAIAASANGCGMSAESVVETGFTSPAPVAGTPAAAFVAAAAANIVARAAAITDRWTITQNKVLLNTNDGVNQ